jgi:hypothetical protein
MGLWGTLIQTTVPNLGRAMSCVYKNWTMICYLPSYLTYISLFSITLTVDIIIFLSDMSKATRKWYSWAWNTHLPHARATAFSALSNVTVERQRRNFESNEWEKSPYTRQPQLDAQLTFHLKPWKSKAVSCHVQSVEWWKETSRKTSKVSKMIL